MPVYNRLRDVRRSRRLTQMELAKAARVSRSTIARLESDETNAKISVDTAIRLAEALQAQTQEVFWYVPSPNHEPPEGQINDAPRRHIEPAQRSA
jgi:DNA-binding XRE family transcriptional regulator